MFDRLQRSVQLTRQSWRVLMADKELMLLPVMSMLTMIFICLTFIVPASLFIDGDLIEASDDPFVIALGVLLYIVAYSVAFFFQAAVIAGATERMSGGDPTISSSLGAAYARLGRILLWGVVAGSVGYVIKSIQERSEWVGKIIMGLIGVAWSLATFFMLPVLVFEDHGLKRSFNRSWEIFRGTWGETVVGSGGIGLASFLAMMLVAVIVMPIWVAGFQVLAIVLGGIGWMTVGVLTSALQGVYVAALYRYATVGESPRGFDDDDLGGAFVAKR